MCCSIFIEKTANLVPAFFGKFLSDLNGKDLVDQDSLMAGNDRKVAPVVSDPSAGRVRFSASSDGWTGWRLSNDLTILEESGEKGVYFAYTPP